MRPDVPDRLCGYHAPSMRLFFSHPWLLLLAPVAFAWAWSRTRQPARAWIVPATDLFPPTTKGWRWPLASWFRLGAALAAIASAAGPRLVLPVIVPAPAALMVVLDTSASMAEADIPTVEDPPRRRMDAAVDALSTILRAQGDQPGWTIGLVGVAGRAEVICPPVPKLEMLEPWLRGIQPVVVAGEAGTDLASGLVLALRVLEGSNSPAKAVLLVSDGENNASPPESGLSLRQLGQAARALGIPCHSLEVAGQGGGEATRSGARGLLSDLAVLTGGQSLKASAASEVGERLEAFRRDWEHQRMEMGAPIERPLGIWLALLALVFLLAAWQRDRNRSRGFPKLEKVSGSDSQP